MLICRSQPDCNLQMAGGVSSNRTNNNHRSVDLFVFAFFFLLDLYFLDLVCFFFFYSVAAADLALCILSGFVLSSPLRPRINEIVSYFLFRLFFSFCSRRKFVSSFYLVSSVLSSRSFCLFKTSILIPFEWKRTEPRRMHANEWQHTHTHTISISSECDDYCPLHFSQCD